MPGKCISESNDGIRNLTLKTASPHYESESSSSGRLTYVRIGKSKTANRANEIGLINLINSESGTRI